jgi:hypothetical protein
VDFIIFFISNCGVKKRGTFSLGLLGAGSKAGASNSVEGQDGALVVRASKMTEIYPKLQVMEMVSSRFY